jgi:hypothetical protein
MYVCRRNILRTSEVIKIKINNHQSVKTCGVCEYESWVSLEAFQIPRSSLQGGKLLRNSRGIGEYEKLKFSRNSKVIKGINWEYTLGKIPTLQMKEHCNDVLQNSWCESRKDN